MKTTVYAGCPTLSLLGLIFVTLKLMGYINWSWWWVLAPFWIPAAIGLLALFVIGLITFILIWIRR